ncbi:hypothetical protein [Algoriphagus resistens]|uniref:hypothetical protein n=1 Tax=Algoriphagus resistens TaxID=1750590 RepID=UPI000716A86F|nr:hypothetical protein [Algoriphagus resistens]
MKRLTILILIVLSVSCDKNEEELVVSNFEVTTVGSGIDCNLILIDFKASDQDRIEKITNSNSLRYQAYNLDKNNFSNEGLTLNVSVRKTFDSELYVCTTLGPSHPWVTVLEAELME